MSELSKSKTKRKFVSLLTNHPWHYQYSIFYTEASESIGLLEDMKSFKQRLRRKCSIQPFLIRVCLYKGKNQPVQAYLSIHTTSKRKELRQLIADSFPASINIVGRIQSDAQNQQKGHTIAYEAPHNLNRFFGKDKINRYSLLNEKLLQLT